ncbi:MAG: hypothetical protein IJ623_05180 [Bacteroidales bacterium]|nr:hypothetical protein [Bacteroidales bacterium]
MRRLFSLILAFFCAQFILGAVTYKSTDIKAGDYVVWDAQRRIFKAIDGGFRGAPAATRNWTIEEHSKDKAYCWYLNEADIIIVQPLEKTKERYVRIIIAL